MKEQPEPRLPDAELEVLACLWRKGSATARDVREALDHYRPMSHGSVVTLLNRLQAKGLVDREKANVGKAFLYKPTRKPEPTYRSLVKDMLQRVFGGNGVALVASLFETHPPDAAEIEQLQKLLDDRRRQEQKQGGQ